MSLLVGLGNHGHEYADTRHNVGAWFMRALAEDSGVNFKFTKNLLGEHALIKHNLLSTHLLLPHTYMNCSGDSVIAAMRYYKLTLNKLMIAHDDLDLPPGVVKVKLSGGSGGHNGLKSIINQLGSNDFYRLRFGIGHPRGHAQVSSYVLSRPTSDERSIIDQAIMKTVNPIKQWLLGKLDFTALQQNLHTII